MGKQSDNTKKFTPSALLGFKPEKGKQQVFYFDSESKGLACRVTATGKKVLIWERRVGKITPRLSLREITDGVLRDTGRANRIIAAARRLADFYNSLAEKGTNPKDYLEEQRAKREAEQARQQAEAEQARAEAEAASKYTLRALLALYVEYLRQRGKDRSAATAESAIRCHVPEALADKPAAGITLDDVSGIIHKVRASGRERQAGTLRSYLSAAYNTALAVGGDSDIPREFKKFAVEANPVQAVRAIPVKAGDHVLSSWELIEYLCTLDETDPTDAVLKVALLSGGQRLSPLVHAKVKDYGRHHSPQQNQPALLTWDSKGKRTAPRAHVVPLIGRAAEIVDALAADRDPEEYLFPIVKRGQPDVAKPGKRLRDICQAIKAAKFDLRDIRRTVETMLSALGTAPHLLGHLQSHGLSGIQLKHYNRYDYFKEKQQVIKAWQEFLNADAVIPAEEEENR